MHGHERVAASSARRSPRHAQSRGQHTRALARSFGLADHELCEMRGGTSANAMMSADTMTPLMRAAGS